MKQAKNNCFNCNLRRRIYRKGWCMFWACKESYCIVWDKIVTGDYTCEHWQRKNKSYDLSPQRFDCAQNDLKRLIDYFDKK